MCQDPNVYAALETVPSTEAPKNSANGSPLHMVERLSPLEQAAKDIREGKSPHKLTVRELLTQFGAKRRGAWVVEWVRAGLQQMGLRTEPDFNSVWIDAEVSLVSFEATPTATQAETDGAPPQSPEPQNLTELTGPTAADSSSSTAIKGIIDDPTYRVGRLEAASKGVISVAPNDSLEKAFALMLFHSYSQLPVMQGDRDVKGAVTWESIGSKLAFGGKCKEVRECMVAAQIMPSDRSLFDAMALISKHQYVLIQSLDKRITGIVTPYDLSLQFQQLTEPFLLIGEIEQHIRRLIGRKFASSELQAFRDPADETRKIESVADLTFGEYVRILENPDCWDRLALGIDRTFFVEKLRQINEIRNDVMHFDPDPFGADDLALLRQFVVLLQSLRDVGAC